MSTKTTSGDATECFSADVVAPDDDYMVDVEFLNTITLPNFPSHSLKLKKYMPLMLLRNLSPPDGLCNGTLQLERLCAHLSNRPPRRSTCRERWNATSDCLRCSS